MPLGRRLMLAMAPLHYGSFWGDWSRVLWILLGLFPGILSITGFWMWWNRVVVRKIAATRAAAQLQSDGSTALDSAFR